MRRLAKFVLLLALGSCETGEPGSPSPGPQGPAGMVPMGVTEFVSRFGPPNPAAAGRSSECTLGEVMLTAASTGRGVPAAGQLLSISQNTALFSLLGTTYGGDGETTFALPDLRGLAPRNMTYMICVTGLFPAENLSEQGANL